METSVTVNNNSPIQDCIHLDDQTQPTFLQLLSIVPDIRVPQILVFKLLLARHICHILYPKEYVLHAQGINVSNAHSETSFFLIFLHVESNMIISAAQSMVID